MARKVPEDESPEDRQRREAQESGIDVARGRAIGRARGRGIPPFQPLSQPFQEPITLPLFPPTQQSAIIAPQFGFSEASQQPDLREVTDPVTGDTISYSVEQSEQMDTPTRRRRHIAGYQSGIAEQSMQPIISDTSHRQVSDPVTGDTISYSVEPGQMETSSRRRHSISEQPFIRPANLQQMFPQYIPPQQQPSQSPGLQQMFPQLFIEQPQQYLQSQHLQPPEQPSEPQPYRPMVERFRDPVTGEPNWDAMRAAIEEENREGLYLGEPPVRQPTDRYVEVSKPAELFGRRLAAKSRAETISEKEYDSSSLQRQVNRLESGERGYMPIPTYSTTGRFRDRYVWKSTTPRFDPSERLVPSPQSNEAESMFLLRRAMSAPALSSYDQKPSRQLDQEENRLAMSLASKQRWSEALQHRKVFKESQFEQRSQDMSKAKSLMRAKTRAIQKKVSRVERRKQVSKNAKIDSVITVEDLSIDIFPITEEDEDQEEEEEGAASAYSQIPQKKFQEYGGYYDDDDDPSYGGYLTT